MTLGMNNSSSPSTDKRGGAKDNNGEHSDLQHGDRSNRGSPVPNFGGTQNNEGVNNPDQQGIMQQDDRSPSILSSRRKTQHEKESTLFTSVSRKQTEIVAEVENKKDKVSGSVTSLRSETYVRPPDQTKDKDNENEKNIEKAEKDVKSKKSDPLLGSRLKTSAEGDDLSPESESRKPTPSPRRKNSNKKSSQDEIVVGSLPVGKSTLGESTTSVGGNRTEILAEDSYNKGESEEKISGSVTSLRSETYVSPAGNLHEQVDQNESEKKPKTVDEEIPDLSQSNKVTDLKTTEEGDTVDLDLDLESRKPAPSRRNSKKKPQKHEKVPEAPAHKSQLEQEINQESGDSRNLTVPPQSKGEQEGEGVEEAIPKDDVVEMTSTMPSIEQVDKTKVASKAASSPDSEQEGGMESKAGNKPAFTGKLTIHERNHVGATTRSPTTTSDDSQNSSETDNINVVVRVRPLNKVESERKDQDIIKFPGDGAVWIENWGSTKSFTFNVVFETEALQEDVFEHSGVKKLIDMSINGFHCTAFAYGQTGSGKTHTITGPPSTFLDENLENHNEQLHGLIPRSFRYLVDSLNKPHSGTFTIQASYLEIYNEQVFDLLNPSQSKHLSIRWSKERGFYVENLFMVECETADDLMAVLEEGLRNRQVGAHNLNETSSRSHSMLSLMIDSEVPDGDENIYITKHGKLTFVDLAGSEKVKDSGSSGEQLIESNNINKSLLVLGNCISALGDAKKRQGHIPYRDSKLTKLLADSLGGNGVALMIACISPSASNVGETMNTLRYANRAKKIRNKPVVQIDPRESLLISLKKELKVLRQENHYLRQQLNFPDKPKGKLAKGNDEGFKELLRQATKMKLEKDREEAAVNPTGASGAVPKQDSILSDTSAALNDNGLYEMLQEYMIENETLRSQNSGLHSGKDKIEREHEMLSRENEKLLRKLEQLDRIMTRSPSLYSARSSGYSQRSTYDWIPSYDSTPLQTPPYYQSRQQYWYDSPSSQSSARSRDPRDAWYTPPPAQGDRYQLHGRSRSSPNDLPPLPYNNHHGGNPYDVPPGGPNGYQYSPPQRQHPNPLPPPHPGNRPPHRLPPAPKARTKPPTSYSDKFQQQLEQKQNQEPANVQNPHQGGSPNNYGYHGQRGADKIPRQQYQDYQRNNYDSFGYWNSGPPLGTVPGPSQGPPPVMSHSGTSVPPQSLPPQSLPPRGSQSEVQGAPDLRNDGRKVGKKISKADTNKTSTSPSGHKASPERGMFFVMFNTCRGQTFVAPNDLPPLPYNNHHGGNPYDVPPGGPNGYQYSPPQRQHPNPLPPPHPGNRPPHRLPPAPKARTKPPTSYSDKFQQQLEQKQNQEPANVQNPHQGGSPNNYGYHGQRGADKIPRQQYQDYQRNNYDSFGYWNSGPPLGTVPGPSQGPPPVMSHSGTSVPPQSVPPQSLPPRGSQSEVQGAPDLRNDGRKVGKKISKDTNKTSTSPSGHKASPERDLPQDQLNQKLEQELAQLEGQILDYQHLTQEAQRGPPKVKKKPKVAAPR
ncbi:uncharacterized protein LOC106161497 [Lingula anatina]|uniref:Uncharacterized protein LOC106161497 n=1 Tax=Lingula anatina TaxID=7574 RepID=A0A2R2MKR3_LINAN|nr:uncharacterized protein LOC106161497 [Lingula anatina]|eukprot:XP_023930806.1 uncharacterized protein LOC106161497 [Lingula anatina]